MPASAFQAESYSGNMAMKKTIGFLLLLFSVIPASFVYGATMRCPDGIVSSGDTIEEVFGRCGPAISVVKDSPNIDEAGFVIRGAAVVERWDIQALRRHGLSVAFYRW